jgi:hypothetical protein
VAGYGGPGYDPPMDHGGHGAHGGDDHGMPGMGTHLSSMTSCVAPDGSRPVATISTGQTLNMTAYYDTNKHPQHGSHPVMGISVMYVADS